MAGWECWQRFELWSQARLQWAKEHPGSVLGSVLDVLREHRRIRKEFGFEVLSGASSLGNLLKEALRLLPDLLRLLKRLTSDRTLPTGVRVRVALLFAYLAMPIDIIPDFVPVLGYADDAIIVVLVLRSVCRRVSLEELRRAWPGTDEGFAALQRLVKSRSADHSEGSKDLA